MTDRRIRTPDDLTGLAFGPDGLLPAVAQDEATGDILMVAYTNLEALERTLESGRMHFWSRSRKRLWRKGESSGNALEVRSLHSDCDGDTILALVRPSGPACHTGEATCFGDGAGPTLSKLSETLRRRDLERSSGSYTTRLLEDDNLRLKKLGEEAAELVTALAQGDVQRAPEEAADLLYHVLVALQGVGTAPRSVLEVLSRRAD